jgi:hypothetical protein
MRYELASNDTNWAHKVLSIMHYVVSTLNMISTATCIAMVIALVIGFLLQPKDIMVMINWFEFIIFMWVYTCILQIILYVACLDTELSIYIYEDDLYQVAYDMIV